MKTLLISKTYTITTQESAEHGDFADYGFVFEDVEFTFRELVRELRDYFNPSQLPIVNGHCWVSTYPETDYQSGEETEYSLHFSHKNSESMRKYWLKALQISGFKVAP